MIPFDTHSGKTIDFRDPDLLQFDFYDISMALSREHRFNGQTSIPFTVAEHLILAQSLVPEWEQRLKRFVFCHDFSEAYLRDLHPQVKEIIGRPYKDLEKRVQHLMYERFCCAIPTQFECARIKEFDKIAVWVEIGALRENNGKLSRPRLDADAICIGDDRMRQDAMFDVAREIGIKYEG